MCDAVDDEMHQQHGFPNGQAQERDGNDHVPPKGEGFGRVQERLNFLFIEGRAPQIKGTF